MPAAQPRPALERLRELITQGRNVVGTSSDPAVLVRVFRSFDEAGRRLLREIQAAAELRLFDTSDGQALRQETLPRHLWAGTVLSDTEHKVWVLEQLLTRLGAGHQQPEAESTASVVAGTGAQVTSKPTVFVVHGHDTTIELTAVRTLEKTLLGAHVKTLHEQTSSGRTIIEQLERHGGDGVAYAVVLMTADDICIINGKEERRARQNVVLELGWFFGSIGRGKVTALVEPGLARPSDYSGIIYIELDAGGAWKYRLLREIQDATDLEVRFSEIPS